MKSRTLPLLRIIALILMIVALPLPGQGVIFIPMFLQAHSDAEKNVALLNQRTKMVENIVKEIIAEMDGVRPPGEVRGSDEQVKDLLLGIQGELAKANSNLLMLKNATEQLGAALSRYTDNPTEENLKKLKAINELVNFFQKNVNDSLDIVKGFLRSISSIRSKDDEKEWNAPNGKYKNERQGVENLWNLLAGRPPVPDVVGKTAQEACALISGVDLAPEIIVLTQKPPADKEYTVKSQDPEGGTLAKPRDVVKIEVYGQVVPNVVDMSYQRAVEELGKANLTVDKVVVKRAFSPKVSEKVTAQEPKAGEPLPAVKTVKLWFFDRYEAPAPPVTPPSTGAQGFQPGDAARVDTRFGGQETIGADRTSIRSGSGKAVWGIYRFGSREEAVQYLRNAAQRCENAIKNVLSKAGLQTTVTHRNLTEQEVICGWTSRGPTGAKITLATAFMVEKTHRDVFVIFYTDVTKDYAIDLAKPWPTIYKNSVDVINDRFPKK